MNLAGRLTRLERQRPPAADRDRAHEQHLYDHLSLAELRELDQMGRRQQAGVPFTTAEEQRIQELVAEGVRRAAACPQPGPGCGVPQPRGGMAGPG